jgi:DNA-binding NarL/FixJ family response regulator
MSGRSVLIISSHPLFAEAITHVLASEGISVAATASDLQAAAPLLEAVRPDTIIVDCEEPCQPQADMLALLDDADKEARLVFLSLADNRMIVHQWRRLGDATSADLVSFLRNGADSIAVAGATS